jgi:hypothetical protein
VTLVYSSTGLWVYNFNSEGSCFGPATEEMVLQWNNRTSAYIVMNYFGYQQKVVLTPYRGCGSTGCRCWANDAVTQSIQKNVHTSA